MVSHGPRRSRARSFPRLIVSGWHTSAIAMRLATEAALKGLESFASPGVDYIKWRTPYALGTRYRSNQSHHARRRTF